MNGKVMFTCFTRVIKPFTGVAEKELQMKQQHVNNKETKHKHTVYSTTEASNLNK